jgi:FkbM family methyltransferase
MLWMTIPDQLTSILKAKNTLPNQLPFKLGKFRYGTMIYYYYDVYVSSSLEQYGEWSQLEIDFMCNLLEPGDTVVDAGAFIGTHTLAFGHKVGPPGKVFAFEAAKESFYCLAGNLMINNLYKADAFQLAVGKEEGVLDLVSIGDVNHVNNYGGQGALEYSPIKGEIAKESMKKVEMRTLDSFNLNECKLIKIDVEGMSLDVLKGAKNTIEKCRPCIFTEVDSPIGKHITDVEENQKLIAFMRNFGYNIYDATSPLFNPNNYFKNPNNIFPGIVSFAVFCCPDDWDITGLPKLS